MLPPFLVEVGAVDAQVAFVDAVMVAAVDFFVHQQRTRPIIAAGPQHLESAFCWQDVPSAPDEPLFEVVQVVFVERVPVRYARPLFLMTRSSSW